MAAKGSVPDFKTLKECLEFLEWLNDRKRSVVRSQVANRLYRLLKDKYEGVDQTQIEIALSQFLNNLSVFHKKLCTSPRGSYTGEKKTKPALNALLACIPQILSAFYFLRYHVDRNFAALGGGGWADKEVGVVSMYATIGMRLDALMNLVTDIDKYLVAKSNNVYGVIPGGFELSELKIGYRYPMGQGYRNGTDMAGDLQKILDKNTNANNLFLDVYSTTVLSTSGTQIPNVANAIRLVRDFCRIFAEVRDEQDFKGHLYSKDKCIEWEKLKAHCAGLIGPLEKIFKQKHFSFTGYARDLDKLSKQSIAKKMASWFRTNLSEVIKNLDNISSFRTNVRVNERLFNRNALATKDRTALTKYFNKNFFPYGFTFYGHDAGTGSNRFQILNENWDGVIKVLKEKSKGLNELVNILNGDICKLKKNKERQPDEPKDGVPQPPAEKSEAESDVESEDEADEPLQDEDDPPADTKTEAAKSVVTKAEAAKPTATKAQSAVDGNDQTQGKKAEGAQNQGKKAEGAQNQGKKAEGAQNQGKKAEGAQNQGKKAEGAQNQGKKAEGAQNQGKKAEGAHSGASDSNTASGPSSGSGGGGAGGGERPGSDSSGNSTTCPGAISYNFGSGYGKYCPRNDKKWDLSAQQQIHEKWDKDKNEYDRKMAQIREQDKEKLRLQKAAETRRLEEDERRKQAAYEKSILDRQISMPYLDGQNVFSSTRATDLGGLVGTMVPDDYDNGSDLIMQQIAAEQQWEKQKQEGTVQRQLDNYAAKQQHKRKQAAKKLEETLKDTAEDIWKFQQQKYVEEIENNVQDPDAKHRLQRNKKLEKQNVGDYPPTSTPSTIPRQPSRSDLGHSGQNTGGRNSNGRGYYEPGEGRGRRYGDIGFQDVDGPIYLGGESIEEDNYVPSWFTNGETPPDPFITNSVEDWKKALQDGLSDRKLDRDYSKLIEEQKRDAEKRYRMNRVLQKVSVDVNEGQKKLKDDADKEAERMIQDSKYNDAIKRLGIANLQREADAKALQQRLDEARKDQDEFIQKAQSLPHAIEGNAIDTIRYPPAFVDHHLYTLNPVVGTVVSQDSPRKRIMQEQYEAARRNLNQYQNYKDQMEQRKLLQVAKDWIQKPKDEEAEWTKRRIYGTQELSVGGIQTNIPKGHTIDSSSFDVMKLSDGARMKFSDVTATVVDHVEPEPQITQAIGDATAESKGIPKSMTLQSPAFNAITMGHPIKPPKIPSTSAMQLLPAPTRLTKPIRMKPTGIAMPAHKHPPILRHVPITTQTFDDPSMAKFLNISSTSLTNSSKADTNVPVLQEIERPVPQSMFGGSPVPDAELPSSPIPRDTFLTEPQPTMGFQIEFPKRTVRKVDPEIGLSIELAHHGDRTFNDVDLDDPYANTADILKDEFKPPEDEGFSGLPNTNLDLNFAPERIGLEGYEDPGMPRDSPREADERVINPFSTDECQNPWSVDTSSTDTPPPPASPSPDTDHLPPPRTVREMLYWFVGLNTYGFIGMITEYVECLLKNANKNVFDMPDALEVTRDPYNLNSSHVADKLTEASLYSATVIYKITHNNDFKAFSNFNFKSVYSQLHYSSDPACLLCQLRDYVYACCHQLAFLKAQCKRGKSLGGWQDSKYGSDIKTSSPLHSFLTDGWDSTFETHPFDPCNACLKSRVRMGFRKDDLPEKSENGITLSTILTPSCGGDNPLLTLSSYLNCLTRRTPRTTGELVSYFHNFGIELHGSDPNELNSLSIQRDLMSISLHDVATALRCRLAGLLSCRPPVGRLCHPTWITLREGGCLDINVDG
ncbi:RIBOSOME BINDING PROTEIN-1 domain containing protein, putative [Babesia bigemina]|uniref:RIBOSOME BINDING PROTEIN-1 domain containing protein, putative n=1 Tax=Babesia bigemina TaxID=5866 RepID=A0A061D427_BABBI|nr:RIBOSOME BINDING PROTEIN-1 domain containing protein, putative [Babesia bigemina]CDR94792.1 RIBOSOME BINDING PROTEIN-1 domain containing protein, putative [Babesia bigemina]|eukprot:XP_012766978.1 RIBOSOME BINDING PROTEIN-1 domain containing protein, putative [Babesia bigemina]